MFRCALYSPITYRISNYFLLCRSLITKQKMFTKYNFSAEKLARHSLSPLQTLFSATPAIICTKRLPVRGHAPLQAHTHIPTYMNMLLVCIGVAVSSTFLGLPEFVVPYGPVAFAVLHFLCQSVSLTPTTIATQHNKHTSAQPCTAQ